MKRLLTFLVIESFLIGCCINESMAYDIKDRLLIEGYVFKDENHSLSVDEKEYISYLKMNLWQDDNLMETTFTDEKGYYCFEDIEEGKNYQITAECLSDSTLMQHQSSQSLTNDFTIMQDYQVKTEVFTMNDSIMTYNLGFTPIAYYIHYELNGGQALFEENTRAYSENEEVILESKDHIQKEGYVFQSWNTKSDGSGESIISKGSYTMPAHNVTFYAIWKKENENAKTVTVKSNQYAKRVETSDEGIMTFVLLLLLSCVGGLLVVKSLRKSK